MRPDAKPVVRVLRSAAGIDSSSLVDWGALAPTARSEAASRTRGALVYKGEEGSPEAGLWECTPGEWDCRIERDELCHFLRGRAVYTDDRGEQTSIHPGDVAFFPAGWKGTCRVIETVRKIYMIR